MRDMKKYFVLTFLLISNLSSIQAIAQVPSSKPLYVIVHGAWGGSWAFKKTDSLLTEQGCKVYRPCLTGQGERVHLASPDINLSTHINDVVNMLNYENLTNVILVGHSYGGMVVTGVADRVPQRIKKVIYLDAFVPMDGESVKTMKDSSSWARNEKMVKNGFLVPEWLKPNTVPGDVPQSLKTFTEPISLKNPEGAKIPAVYILTVDKGKKPEEDDFASQAERARKKKWKVVQMESNHNPQWSATEKLVELLYQNR
jgi:pimeloyl-ACP methyl ester carboxylesterase